MLTRQQKEAIVRELSDIFSANDAVLLTDYRGLKAGEMGQLRAFLRKNSVPYRVVKKTLLSRALENRGIATDFIKGLAGQIAVTWSPTDPIASAKLLDQFSKEHRTLKIIGAVIGKNVLGIEEARALARIPALEQLRGQLVGVFNAPLLGLVRALQWPAQSLVYTVSEVKK